jgi:hypothetical protein
MRTFMIRIICGWIAPAAPAQVTAVLDPTGRGILH